MTIVQQLGSDRNSDGGGTEAEKGHTAAGNSIKSFKGYGKLDEAEERAFKQKTRRRLIILDELAKLSQYAKKLQAETDYAQVKHDLDICKTMFNDALDRFYDSTTSLEVGDEESILSDSKINDLKTQLSTTITDQETCLYTLEELNTTKHFNATLVQELRATMQNSSEFASNSLSTDFNIPIHRRLLGFVSSEFPAWIHSTEKRLLQESKHTPNVIVAQDGSGHFKMINEAVKLIGKKNESRFVIYTKEVRK
ncbi:pectinesterase 3-like [Hibiscus syriacus]|uniref:pectinesterase 3-like n=1 Tax=Hibiscus syriacus TaxID=106335 RepID=UPI0019225630|nr:pectinesterase 3-like [Hibiscus syriacus]